MAHDLHANLLRNALKNNMEATPTHKIDVNHLSISFHKIGTREAQKLIRALQNSTARVLIKVSSTVNILTDIND